MQKKTMYCTFVALMHSFPLIFLSHHAKGFRGEFFFKSAYQKKELPMTAMSVNESGRNEHSL
jgi:hypothetical protein